MMYGHAFVLVNDLYCLIKYLLKKDSYHLNEIRIHRNGCWAKDLWDHLVCLQTPKRICRVILDYWLSTDAVSKLALIVGVATISIEVPFGLQYALLEFYFNYTDVMYKTQGRFWHALPNWIMATIIHSAGLLCSYSMLST